MILKFLKQGLLAASFLLFLCALTPSSFAMDYSAGEISLNEAGVAMIHEDRAFNSISVQTEKDINSLMVNFGGGWENVEIHDDGFGYEALLFSSPTYTVEFKADEDITLKTNVFYYEQDTFVLNTPDISNLTASTQIAARNFDVITRSEWGADEGLRYWTPEMEEASKRNGSTEKTYSDPCGDMYQTFKSELGLSYIKEYSPDGNLLTWPLQYMKTLRKFVIHHTDSEIRDLNGDSRMDSRDYKAIVRAIYQYHTVSRGWGDIGYNYIIDPLGNIYEGRYGGDKVIGAHALCYNNGTMGISIIGNYENETLSEPALQSLISLLARKAKIYRIDPSISTVFRGKKLPNIIGHRDLRATSCPGDALYALLPRIRDRVALAIRSGSFTEGNLQVENLDYNAEALTDLSNITLDPNQIKNLVVRFKNTGKKTWDHNTWLHVALNNNVNARVIPVIEDKSFVAADLRERSVAPGQTGTFDIQIEAGYRAGNYSFELAPVVNGRYKVSRSSIYVNFNVNQANLSYEVVKQDLPSGNIFQGQNIQASIDLKNTGNVVWKNYGSNQITLGTSGPRDRKSMFIEDNPSRLGYLFESRVEPGEVGHFIMDLDVPIGRTGTVTEQFTPVIENVGWMKDKALGFQATLKEPIHLARITKLNSFNTLRPGEMKKVEIEIENRGDLEWNEDNMQITLLGRGLKVFKTRLVPDKIVKSGEKIKMDFWVQAPYEEGRHSIFLRGLFNKIPIRGGVARYVVSVPITGLRAQLIDQGEKYVTLSPRQEAEVTVKFKNTGNVIWRNKGANAIYLGATNPRDRLSRLYYEGNWSNKYRSAVLNETVVYPGEVGSFTFKVKPMTRGIFEEGFQLVLENVGWVVGGNVRWYFRVFGNPVESSSVDSAEQEANKEVIERIASAQTTTADTVATVSTPTTVEASEPTYTPPTVTERPFRVRLSYGDATSILTANTNYVVANDNGDELFSLNAGDEVTMKRSGNVIYAQVGSASKSSSVIRLIPETDGIIEIKTWDHSPAWNKALNDNQYRDVVEVRVVNDETAYINELPLESYMKGLAELSNDAPFEKQKAIAVLARSYARFYMEEENRKFPGLPYDGADDPDIFQRYLGYGIEKRSPNFVGAVIVTRNRVVTYEGELVKTPYFSQSDGRTRSAQEVWGWTHTPYLKSVADPWCEGLYKRGHGVGLSGCGATGQANEGKTYENIIKYYYQGVQIEELNFE